MHDRMRYFLGYAFGFTVFILLIPLGLIRLSKFDYLFGQHVFIGFPILRYVLSFLFFSIGSIFAIWSNVFLLMIGKGGPAEGFGIAISPQTKKLVTTGPYSHCRNPMVFGAFCLYISVVVFINSITGVITLFAFLILAINYLKRSEEKRLERDFGNEFFEYKRKVPMIFPYRW